MQPIIRPTCHKTPKMLRQWHCREMQVAYPYTLRLIVLQVWYSVTCDSDWLEHSKVDRVLNTWLLHWLLDFWYRQYYLKISVCVCSKLNRSTFHVTKDVTFKRGLRVPRGQGSRPCVPAIARGPPTKSFLVAFYRFWMLKNCGALAILCD